MIGSVIIYVIADTKQKLLMMFLLGNIWAEVRQGSVLGPLLFYSILIDDLADVKKLKILLFADDKTLFTSVGYNYNEISDQLNADMCKIQNWADQWLVQSSPSKTKTMFVSTKRQFDSSLYPLKIRIQNLNEVSEHEHLEVWIAKDLSWKNTLAVKQLKSEQRINIFNFFRPL